MTNTKTRSRRKFTTEFKARVAMEALQERLTLSELSKKYEVHPNPCETGDELWRGLDGYFRFYNDERLHQSLGYKTPASRYLLKKDAA